MRYEPYDKSLLAKQIKHYVDKERNYRNPVLTSAIVAMELGIARSTLIKVMKEEMHTTFAAYLAKCRVQHAHHLLMTRKGRTDFENVALLVGFGSKATLVQKYYAEYKIKL